MAIRKVFSDESDKQITAYILASGKFYIEIKKDDDLAYITLSPDDAKEFIMELYRMKGKLMEPISKIINNVDKTGQTTYKEG